MSTAMSTLSAVVVTHNSAQVIEPCLRSLRAMLPGTQIVVVDNASEDGTREVCERLDGVVLVENSANLGFGRACNLGASRADGAHVLFLNPDVRLVAVDLTKLQTELKRTPFGLVGPLFRDGARVAPLVLPDSPWAMDIFAHAAGPLRPRELPRLPRVMVRRNAWWPAGAMLLAARGEFLRIGGFKEEFFLYYEDRDLARRYRSHRLPVGTTSSMVALHTPGTSSASSDPLRMSAHGWAYLGWIEYLSMWNGVATARRAVGYVEGVRAQTDRALAHLESRGPLSCRARRKRSQLRGIQAFVRWQSTRAEGTADRGFCPQARQIIAERTGDI